ncbi:hypothetical protein GDO78_022274 [Eleutherodactylus coqui]|uniref:Thioredoxin domain-containing protein n=1 Tax=Eleutherodactylus coqui TaxID=57060 RepID=A0A8J6E9L1_ELECQ|nr:hypothetical protein GDO78_022274 [Eleutherodactylus coqui]
METRTLATEQGDLKAFLDIPANKLVVIDFLALWCGPCKMIAPFFNGLVEKYPDVVFIEVDVDDAQEVAAYCEVRSVPTFQFHKNGERIYEYTSTDKSHLEHKIQELK